MEPNWVDVGAAADLQKTPVQQVMIGRTKIALTYLDGRFGAISGVCNHVGGPLGEGRLKGEFVVCAWHYWKFHFATGKGEPGYEEDAVPAYEIKVETGRVWINPEAISKRSRKPHKVHPLAREIKRADGPIRVLGIATTALTVKYPRYSTSDDLLESALGHAKDALGCETQLIRLRELSFRHCEGFYSKSAQACTWPCSITQMDAKDQMEQVYEGVVHWGDVILISTPIRWGGASSLYYKMIERMNCIQNQETIANKTLLRNKVAAFIITGGQDNIQAVAGQLLGFFSEVGCQFPQFPFIAHSRGWSAEDMENNTRYVRNSKMLHDGAAALAGRAVALATVLVQNVKPAGEPVRGGRKAHQLDTRAQLPLAGQEEAREEFGGQN